MRGKLYLVAAPLDFGCTEQTLLTDVLPQASLEIAARLRHWVCENAKTTRAYLKRIDSLVPLGATLQEITITELPRSVHKKGDHAGEFDARPLLAAAIEGHDVGLVSEAGMPAIADPGSSVVRAAHALGIEVVALVGPSSLLLALAGAGMNGQHFAFQGYLPSQDAPRVLRIRELEAMAGKTGQTQIFIETPYRNAALLRALLAHLKADTHLAVCWGATLPGAVNRSATVARWNQQPIPDDARPAVFMIGQ